MRPFLPQHEPVDPTPVPDEKSKSNHVGSWVDAAWAASRTGPAPPSNVPTRNCLGGRDALPCRRCLWGGVATRKAAARFGFMRASLAAGVVLVLAQSAAHLDVTLGKSIAFDASVSGFDLERNNGVPDVVSILVITAAAVAAFVLGAHHRAGRHVAWLLGTALLALGVDDALHTEERGTYGLVVIATFFAVGALVVRVALRTPPATRAPLLGGFVLLALDVKFPFAYDQLMNLVGRPALVRGDLLYEVGVVLDEGMELMGWILVATSLWVAALAARDGALDTAPDLGSREVALELARVERRESGRPT